MCRLLSCALQRGSSLDLQLLPKALSGGSDEVCLARLASKKGFSKAEMTTCLLNSLGFDWDMCTWTACSKDQVEQRCETPTQAALDSFREKISVCAGSTH